MKNIGTYIGGVVVLIFLIVIFTQTNESGFLLALSEYEDQTKLFETISLWATLLIAFITSMMVWVGGRKMHGGVFGKVLTFFSIGMTLIFLGIVVETPWFPNVDSLYLKVIHDSLYIVGYVMMGLAASKLLDVIKGK